MKLSVVNNKNDMYIFCELIDQLEPRTVLDVSLFLQRIGAVSRTVLNREIDAEIVLVGYDCMKEGVLPVYHAVYTQIYAEASLLRNREYDLAVLLHVPDGAEQSEQAAFTEVLCSHTRYILTDVQTAKNYPVLRQFPSRPLSVESDQYLLFQMKGE